MSELAKHLPLSQREGVDETNVSSNWSPELRTVLQGLASIIERMPQHWWSAESARAHWSVRETIGLLLWQLNTSPAQRWSARARQLPLHPIRPGVALENQLRRSFMASDPVEARSNAISALRTRADSADAASIAELSFAVCALLDVRYAPSESESERVGAIGAALPPRASGAVALRQVLRAPLPVRAAARGNTLVASDAGWQLGHGPAVTAEAAQILLFLFGRSSRMPGR